MAGPWEKYQGQKAGPWAKYAKPQRQPQHFDFDPANVPQANAGPQDNDLLAGLTGAVEGIPVIGPYLQSGVENVAAGIGSLLTGEDQQQVRSEMGGMVDKAQADNPVTARVAGTLGAIAGTAPLVAAAPAAFGAGSGGPLARTLASGASGALLGGSDAAVRSGGDIDAIISGAKWGGGLGLAGPAVGQAVGAGARTLANRLGPGASRAQQAFGRAVGADAIDDIGGRLGAMGDDAMPMDLGPNLQRQAGALAATPGRSQEIIRSAIADRQGASGSRVAGALDDALGQSVDTLSVADDIIARRGAAAKPLYDAAYSKPMPFTPKLKSLLQRPSMRSALKKAEKLASDEGARSKQWFAQFSDGGERATGILDASGAPISAANPKQVSFVRTPDVRELDLTKRALDDMISTAQRAGNNNEARILTQQKNLLLGMIDEAVPEYAAARQAFSGPTAVLDAMDEGRNAFKNSVTPSQLRKQLSGMGQAEREAYIQGARSQVADIMGTARNDALAARSAFQKGYNKEKLELLIGKDQAKRLLDSLEAETAFTRTRDVVTGNSETAARLAAQSEVGAGNRGAGVLEQAGNLNFGTAAARLGDRLLGGARSAAQNRTNEELARLLTSRDPKAVTRTIQMVQAAQRRGDLTAQKAREIIQSVTLGGSQRRPLEITVTP